MRFVALILIALQAFPPAGAWAQGTRSTSPASTAGSPAPPTAPSKGPVVERRLALVIGNNNYKTAPLVNPINDARLVTETLKGLGFEVILRENVNLRDFKAVMRQFVARLENEEGTALLYYAGHGVQIEGRNYLLPVDVGIGDEYEVRDESLDLEETLMSRLSRARKRERIIILDACRDNPFRAAKQQQTRGIGPRGFAQMGSDEKGTLIVYSTSPGHTAEDGQGRNSIFTQHFAVEIQKEGVEVGQALRSVFNQVNTQTKGRQTPWYNSSLLGDFYFKPPNVRAEEERRRREIQEKVEAALRDQKRDEAARIQAVLSEREKEREKERIERERMYNAQIAEMKAMLERRDKDLEQARVQMASSARSRDEQLANLAAAEAERRRLERERPPVPAAPPPPTREQEEARKKADADLVARKADEQRVREARDRFLKLEAERRNADERAQKEEAEREAKAAAELARRETAAKNRAEKERLAAEQAKRKAAEQARREESARLAKAAAEEARVFEEQAKTATQERQVAEKAAAPVVVAQQASDEPIRRISERVKQAQEEADRAVREAETQERLAKIEEGVRRRTSLEMEMLGRKANMPLEIAALMTTEPQKVVVPNSNGDFYVRGVRLPADVAIRPAPRNAPTRCAEFLGAWGGGRWNGERTAEIWVESIDDNCRVRATYGRGGQGLSGEPATYVRGEGSIRGDTLTMEFGPARIALRKDGDAMVGRWSSGVNSASARFVKLPPDPQRSVSVFAGETNDYGASPSRVISESQISDSTMLALPMTVPSVDTLTTVQLDAFLKSHPDAVLVDAVVDTAHLTIVGAYWLPELGQVTLGRLELGQIEDTMKKATGGDRSRPVIVFERSSTFGWFGYHGVLRLLGMGYSNIYWYRGGLDAWHDAQFTLAQARPLDAAR